MAITSGDLESDVRDRTSARMLIGLEGLRFAAAFAVLVLHYRYFYFSGGTLSGYLPEQQPFYDALAPFYTNGYCGVELFWCISGFIFAWKYNVSIGAGEISFRRFAILRFARLYPLHFATLLAVALLQAIYFHSHVEWFVFQANDIKHFALNLVFASYWGFQPGYSFNGPSWSISAEILVYVLFFFCCRLAGNRARLATPIALGAFPLAALAQFLFSTQSAVLLAADFFYLGVLTCQLYTMIMAQTRRARLVLNWLVVGVTSALLLLTGFGQLSIEAASLVMLPAIVLTFQLLVPDRNARVNRCLTFLGDMTYASYLLQFPVQLAIVQVMAWTGPWTEDLRGTRTFFLAYVLTVCVLARIVFRTFERPAQMALRRTLLGWPAARSRPGVASTIA